MIEAELLVEWGERFGKFPHEVAAAPASLMRTMAIVNAGKTEGGE